MIVSLVLVFLSLFRGTPKEKHAMRQLKVIENTRFMKQEAHN
jgi:hypothetical protein